MLSRLKRCANFNQIRGIFKCRSDFFGKNLSQQKTCSQAEKKTAPIGIEQAAFFSEILQCRIGDFDLLVPLASDGFLGTPILVITPYHIIGGKTVWTKTPPRRQLVIRSLTHRLKTESEGSQFAISSLHSSLDLLL